MSRAGKSSSSSTFCGSSAAGTPDPDSVGSSNLDGHIPAKRMTSVCAINRAGYQTTLNIAPFQGLFESEKSSLLRLLRRMKILYTNNHTTAL
jgi:hypothetical protein